MKTEFCPICNRPMELVQVLNERQAVMRCKHCHLEKVFTYDKDVFPSNINSFNWGAFVLWPFWGLGNRMSYTFILGILVAFIGLFLPLIIFDDFTDDFSYRISTMILIPLVFSVYYGVNGNMLSWKKKMWNTVENFEDEQSAWNIVGIIFIIGIISFVCITLFKVNLFIILLDKIIE